MSDGSREALRGALVAGFLFFVLILSAGHAIAPDGGSSSGGGTISQTVNANAPRLIAFDIRNAANTSSVMGTQLDVLTTFNFWITVNNTNGWASITNLYVNLWYDAGVDATSYDSANSAANYKINITYTNAAATSPTPTQWALIGGEPPLLPAPEGTKHNEQTAPNYKLPHAVPRPPPHHSAP